MEGGVKEMSEEENEFWLMDRIEKIKQINEDYDLEKNGMIAFSGGKDSLVLHYLLDMALPGNKIPRVYYNTGIEFRDVVDFVKSFAEKDERFEIINSGVNIKEMLETYGYPFKSKEYSKYLQSYKNGSRCSSIKKRLSGNQNGKKSKFAIPKILRYQWNDSFKMKISDQCCNKLKKNTAKKYARKSGRTIAILGLRMEEGGQRANKTNCVILDSKTQKLKKFKPLNPMKNEWMDWFIKKFNIKLCKLYYPPYNFKRTGCKGCPYSLYLQRDLDKMVELLPAERKQCELVWGKVYDEYRRIGYRLRPQLNLFELNLLENILDKKGEK